MAQVYLVQYDQPIVIPDGNYAFLWKNKEQISCVAKLELSQIGLFEIDLFGFSRILHLIVCDYFRIA